MSYNYESDFLKVRSTVNHEGRRIAKVELIIAPGIEIEAHISQRKNQETWKLDSFISARSDMPHMHCSKEMVESYLLEHDLMQRYRKKKGKNPEIPWIDPDK